MKKPRRKPNTIKHGGEERCCVVCDQMLPMDRFTNSNHEVCTLCRCTRAYQEVIALKDFTRWCPDCEAHQPVTSFWKFSSGLSAYCRVHESLRKRNQRALDMTSDGYRKRWFASMKSHVACTQCGATTKLCFVHLHHEDKGFAIAGSANTYSVEQIKHELRKCDTFCRTCMDDLMQSEVFKSGKGRATPATDWDAVFFAVDEYVKPLVKPKKTTQLPLDLG